MTKNNSQDLFDSECGFAAALVAVLYDEASDRERLEFERHAAQCESCRAEFAAFRAVGDQFAEYRREVLQPLAAPESFAPQFVAPKQIEIAQNSWFDRVRAFLFPIGNAPQIATALAAFVLCAALIFAVAISTRRDERQVVQNDSDKKTEIVKPVEKSETAASQTTAPQIAPPQEKPRQPAPQPQKSDAPPVQSPKTAARPFRNKVVRPIAPTRNARRIEPRALGAAVDLEITDDEQSDDGAPLLADLFDEIGSLE